MQNPPVFFVVGPAGHGKTTARELLCEITHGLKGASCSDIIYHFLAVRRNVSVELLKQIPKEELRPALIAAGDYLTGQIGTLQEVAENTEIDSQIYRVPSILIRTLYLNGHNIIDGVRRRLELKDAFSHLEWNGVRHLTIHVENPNGPKINDNAEDLKEFADECIWNDGTREELRGKLTALVEKHFGPQDTTFAPMQIVDLPVKKAS